MDQPPAVLRPARSADAAAAGPLLYSTGAAAFLHIFGLGDEGRAVSVLCAAFAEARGAFSHRLALCAALPDGGASGLHEEGTVVGLALGYPARRRSELDRALLPLLLRRFSPLELPRMMLRGLRAARLVRGVPSDAYYLAHIAVDPAHRRARIGAQLLGAVLTQARAAGHPSCALHVSVHNQPARALYERCGFQVFAEYRDPALERRTGLPGQYAMRCALG